MMMHSGHRIARAFVPTLMVVVLATPSEAGEAKQKVNGGPLSITTTSVSFPSYTLTGAPGSVAASASGQWTIKNARGRDTGWTLTMAGSATLTSAPGAVETVARTLPIGNIDVSVGTVTAGSGSDPTTNISTSSISLSTASQSIVTCSSTCKGRYHFTPSFTLTVPANAFRSNYSAAVGSSALNPYTATLTLTIS